jgi:hypothetical protein
MSTTTLATAKGVGLGGPTLIAVNPPPARLRPVFVLPFNPAREDLQTQRVG